MKWTTPNIFIAVRLVAAPGVAVMFLYFNRPWADWFALVFFIGAAVTDWFDGYLARHWKQESKLGTMQPDRRRRALAARRGGGVAGPPSGRPVPALLP